MVERQPVKKYVFSSCPRPDAKRSTLLSERERTAAETGDLPCRELVYDTPRGWRTFRCYHAGTRRRGITG